MESVQVGNVLIASDRLAELDGSRVVASVSRENFRSGEITVARVCKRPYVLSLIALALIVLGALTARGVIIWLLYGGTHSMEVIMMILLIPAGAWLLYEAWRRAPMILVQTGRGVVRLEFKGPRTQETVDALVRAASERGYDLRRGSVTWR
jgi:hypothetical protein